MEKEYKKQQINSGFTIPNFLLQKEEEAKNKFKWIRQLRKAIFGNKRMKELNNMEKEAISIFENDNNSQGMKIKERTSINGIEKTIIIEEKEEKEGKENI